MSSNNKAYEMVEETSTSFDTERIPEAIPVQNAYAHPYSQPQYQSGAIPVQYHPGMLPPQFIQQPMPQFVGVSPQYMVTVPQPLPANLHEMNPLQLMAKRQEYEREIESFKHIVPLSWVLIAFTTVGVIGAIVLFILQFHSPFVCALFRGYWYSHCYTTLFFIIFFWVIAAVSLLAICLHFITITGYKKRSAKYMTCLYVCFSIFFGVHMLALCNMIGMAIYGYLAITTYKLKKIFDELRKLDQHMSSQGMGNSPMFHQPGTQLQMATL